MKAWLAAALSLMAGPVAAEAWQIGCDATGCKVGQAIIEPDNRMVARVLVMQLQGDEVIEVLFPLGVSLLTPIVLQVDDRPPFEVRTASCDTSGCFGVVPDAAGAVAAFKAGADLKLRFTGFENGTSYYYSFTLIGFTDAYETYRKGPP